ncbi:hypothetical protein [uncultured Tateyamaria sp.]|uniref:hypothetical protein n=1 Tax=uncultured Tateyamaria sp. TaxID=455651 RepID=UPI00262EF8C8|nr:hypothetical protein [uncultured Tateyamaria sp.]
MVDDDMARQASADGSMACVVIETWSVEDAGRQTEAVFNWGCTTFVERQCSAWTTFGRSTPPRWKRAS